MQHYLTLSMTVEHYLSLFTTINTVFKTLLFRNQHLFTRLLRVNQGLFLHRWAKVPWGLPHGDMGQKWTPLWTWERLSCTHQWGQGGFCH